MGKVYLAHDNQLDRLVALKVPHVTEEDNPEHLQRFLREAQAAANIDHPNICPVYDVGAIDGVHYLTMAYVEGKPLKELVPAGKQLPQLQVAFLVRKLAQTLAEAHARGIIHRDLKPSNIMINQRREPVIMDFGLARRDSKGDARLTQSGTVIGTPAYMAPEQLAGDIHAMGPACDIYSLGVILYELLTGQLPFKGNITALMAQIISKEPPLPSTLRADLDPALDAVCQKAMAKKLADRYGSMSAMADGLSIYLRAQSSTAESGAAPGPRSPSAVPAPAAALAHPRVSPVAAAQATPFQTTQLRPASPRSAPGRRMKVVVACCSIALVAVIGYVVFSNMPGPSGSAGPAPENKDDVVQKDSPRPKPKSQPTTILEHSPKEHVDYRKAIADYNKAIELEPGNGSNYNSRGIAYHSAGQFGLAIADYTKAIELIPRDAVIFTNRGLVYLDKGDVDLAINDFEMAIDINPKNAVSYRGLGEAFAKKKDYDRAINNFGTAIKLRPSDRLSYSSRGDAYFTKGQFKKAVEDYTLALELKGPALTPKNAAAVLASRAYGYLGLEDWAKAIADFTKAIDRDDKNADAFAGRGRARDGKGDPESAIKDLERAIDLQREKGWHYYWLASVYIKKKDFTKAIDYLTLALERKDKPDFAVLYGQRGYCFYRRGPSDWDAAVKDLKLALAANPNHAASYRNMGNIHFGKKEYGPAIENYTQAISREPEKGLNYYYRADAYYSKEEYDKAIVDYTKALTCTPTKDVDVKKEILTNRGLAFVKKESLDQAIKDFNSAIDLDPDYAPAYRGRGHAYKAKGDFKKAEADEKKAKGLGIEK
jgi:serine/threonine protein kinase/tetratricopeptide (TPR) repeat protein